MNKVFIPISIVVSGLIIAGAIFLTSREAGPTATDEAFQVAIAPIDSSDHIIGNPDADIIIVEYSDLECPYCAAFHTTMKRIMDEYGPTGKVAWVYRHFPLSQIHPLAQEAAEATECVAKIGGNDKFWEYTDALIAGSPDSLTSDNLVSQAVTLGLNEAEFKACLASDYPKQQVAQDIADGNAIASVDDKFGTPYNIMISKSGVQTPIRGNQPYANVKGAIDAVLNGQNAQ